MKICNIPGKKFKIAVSVHQKKQTKRNKKKNKIAVSIKLREFQENTEGELSSIKRKIYKQNEKFLR